MGSDFLFTLESAASLLIARHNYMLRIQGTLEGSQTFSNFGYSAELLWRMIYLLLETINSDPSAYLYGKEASSRRIVSLLMEIPFGDSDVKIISQKQFQSLKSLLRKLDDFVRPDESTRAPLLQYA